MNKSTWHANNNAKLRGYAKKYREKDPERYKAYQRKWYAQNREKMRARGKERYAQKWAIWLKYKYGITAERYHEMLAEQGHKCAICRTDEPGGRFKNKRFHVDHCHATGAVRGLLCNACNHLLGCARDVVSTLHAAAAYLERRLHSEKRSV
jgi:hypothetical protein